MASMPNCSSGSDSDPNLRKIWRSGTSITIPSADILTFAFANLGRYHQDKPIYVDAHDPLSYISARNAKTTIRRLVQGLKEHGLQEGDRVCLVSSNTIHFPVVWLAVIGAGGVVVGTNPSYTTSELSHHFKVSNPKYLIVQVESLHTVEAALSACIISPRDVFVLCKPEQTVPEGHQPWQTLLDYGECDWETESVNYSDVRDKTAAFSFTSGTTGLPKAAVITHRYLVAQTLMIERRLKDRPYQPSQLVCLPVFHAFAAQIALVLPLRLGITTYFLPRYDIRNFSRSVKTFNITDTAIVPPMVTSLLRLPEEERQSLASLRYILCAGAPIAATLQSQLYQRLSPEAVIAQVWGTTELGWASMFSWDEKDTSGSVGRLLPGVEMKLLREDGTATGQDLLHGEAYVRSPSMFTHYHDNHEASALAFDHDGFYRTGDRIHTHADKIFIDDRVKDTMKVKGFQVSPAEIESVLLQHPMIADAAVVGVSSVNDDGLEITLPRAYVVRQFSTAKQLPDVLTEDEVVLFAASKLTSYKKLSGGVVMIDQIPRNATGKILRHLLTDVPYSVASVSP